MNRNRREGITDAWHTATGERSAKYGRGKRWLVRWVDESREHSKSFDKKSDATAYLSELTTARNTGRFVHERAGRVTVAALWGEWTAQAGHLSQKTIASRETAYCCHVMPRWAGVTVGDIRVTAVRAWVADMAQAGVGVPTIERAVGVLRGLCELAVDDRRISANPCVNVKLPRRSHPDRAYLSVPHVQALAEAITFRPEVVELLAYTGLRWGEMAALRVSDFDMLRRRVDVSRSVTEVRGHLVWGTPKTHERRSVPFPAVLAETIAPLMAGKGRDDLVFTAESGGVLRNSIWRPRVFDKAVKGCQRADDTFPSLSPHDLRHTAASLAISAGANVKAVQRMLGHAKASMTLDTYADLFDDDLDLVAGALDAKIRATSGTTAGPLRDGTTPR
ncbi:integrase family protein [Gordonia bronchialis DSM 43247]|uniref:Integrase family protein n=1 Tax=Gordonia bronchialis (strain ATCC 25592 / DSM 43247 / BCRC 13721 / JCM 3198 / KCTC 3076 / NBRC 16047 / NCTC 10667) TaxID=526226 RepID=D0L6E4_GORB4|nr:site-specific integrase [Gordonia bronchialis]ACY20701.1 integrase family protein [Gordonia bronchialis DSM 43247]MCC3323474.1 site-specific integrase [Gordonia bronchialis]STQ63530.1 Integrase [Gordonia bronchialis]